MKNNRALSRALITAAATLSVGLFAAIPSASAHVRASVDNPTPGSYAVITFKVPNESETGALTTGLSVSLPDVKSASTELMPGWTARLERDTAAGTVKSVTWTAAPGTGIAPDEFALFRVSVKLPDDETVDLPATQTYSDGTVVKWDQPAAADGAEPQYPAPVVNLTGSVTEPVQVEASAPTDPWARWLAGGALVVAAAALGSALLLRRRS